MVILQDILINEIVFELFLKNLDADAIVTFYRLRCICDVWTFPNAQVLRFHVPFW